ncbi:variant SH3 domain protein [Teladorsagia circumcincta]|uniref:Variant SH3 domain protein n=1 Tax=Teladorsagia circumcincta TaxID=45464 RepID=A0A2G9UXV6_TELCI|nr:variant SH3 domain protein [Teladorsagia circumcincta]
MSSSQPTKPSFAVGAAAPPSFTSPLYSTPPQYDVVPGSNTSSSSQAGSTLYALPPQYDVVPGSTATPSTTQIAPSHVYPVLYEEPPAEDLTTIPAYDVPPVENGRLPSIGKMTAVFDFKPVGPNQLEIVAGERLDLIQAHDDGGNPEWIWVQRPNGEHGFVPAAYCKAV